MSHFVMMAGGTGGHVIPALAVARALQQKGHAVTWIGTQQGIEHRLVPQENIEIDYIDIAGFRRSGFMRQLATPFMLIKAVWQSLSILRARQADAVIGFGGFAAGPGGIAAIILRLPLVLHEQNSIAGATNKYLAKFARKVMTGFAQVQGLKRYEWLGNPVRAEIAALGQDGDVASIQSKDSVNILVVGGSRGAHALNKHLPDALTSLQNTSLQIWHQTGEKDESSVRMAYSEHSNVQVSAYIQDMATAYKWADIVICRAGAMTVSEVCAAGVVALFVPYPYAVSDHQRKNAQSLVQQGAALLLDESELSDKQWIVALENIVNDAGKREAIRQAALQLAKPEATANVAARCEEVLNA